MKKSVLTTLIAASALFTGVAFAGSYTADAGYTAADTSAMAGEENALLQGMYVGVGVNRSATNSNDVTATNAAGAEVGTYEPSSTKYGFDLLVGKHFNDMFAAEVSYNSYGKNEYTESGTGGDADGSSYTYSPMWSTMVMGVANTPTFHGISGHAKAGLAFFSGTTKDVTAAGVEETSQYRGTNPAFGFGVQYDYRQFGLSFDWTRIQASDNNNTSSTYIPDQYSLNFIYNI